MPDRHQPDPDRRFEVPPLFPDAAAPTDAGPPIELHHPLFDAAPRAEPEPDEPPTRRPRKRGWFRRLSRRLP